MLLLGTRRVAAGGAGQFQRRLRLCDWRSSGRKLRRDRTGTWRKREPGIQVGSLLREGHSLSDGQAEQRHCCRSRLLPRSRTWRSRAVSLFQRSHRRPRNHRHRSTSNYLVEHWRAWRPALIQSLCVLCWEPSALIDPKHGNLHLDCFSSKIRGPFLCYAPPHRFRCLSAPDVRQPRRP